MSPRYEMIRKNVLDTSTGKGSTQLSKKDNESKSFNFSIELWPGKSEEGLKYTRKQTPRDKRNFTVFFAVYKDTTSSDLKSVSSSEGRTFTKIDPFNNRHHHKWHDEKQEGFLWRARLKPRGLSLPAAVHRFLFLSTGSFFGPKVPACCCSRFLLKRWSTVWSWRYSSPPLEAWAKHNPLLLAFTHCQGKNSIKDILLFVL